MFDTFCHDSCGVIATQDAAPPGDDKQPGPIHTAPRRSNAIHEARRVHHCASAETPEFRRWASRHGA